MMNNQELAIRTTPVTEPVTRRSIITMTQLAYLLKIPIRTIKRSYQKNIQQIKEYTWLETINNRKHLYFLLKNIFITKNKFK